MTPAMIFDFVVVVVFFLLLLCWTLDFVHTDVGPNTNNSTITMYRIVDFIMICHFIRIRL